LLRKTIIAYRQPNIHTRPAARQICLRTGKPAGKSARNSKKSVFSTRPQLLILKTKHELQENDLGGIRKSRARKEPPVPRSVAFNLRTENKKKNAKRSEPNHEKLRMSPAGVRPRGSAIGVALVFIRFHSVPIRGQIALPDFAKTIYCRTNPASRRKQMTATRESPGSSRLRKFDLYLITGCSGESVS